MSNYESNDNSTENTTLREWWGIVRAEFSRIFGMLGDIATETDNRISKLNEDVFGSSTTVKCQFGDAIPSGAVVILKSITIDGVEYSDASDYIEVNSPSVYGNLYVNDVCPDNYKSTNVAGFYAGGKMSLTNNELNYATFEVSVSGAVKELNDELEEIDNNIKNNVYSVTGGAYTVIRYAGEVMPTGDKVIVKEIHSPYGINTENSLIMCDDCEYTIRVNGAVKVGCQGEKIRTISVGSQYTMAYDENWYAVFEVTTKGTISTLEERIAALESVIANIQNAEEASF